MQCTGLNVFSAFRSSPETLAKWCLLMPPSFFSSPLPRPQNLFLWGLFSFGGIKRSRTERDRVIMAGGVVGSCYFWLKIVSHSRLCALARCRGEATTPHFAIPHSKSVGRNSRTHQTNQQYPQLFCDGLPRSVHEFLRCFHPFGRSRFALSEVGLQATIHHFWSRKTTRKLVFSPVPLPCKLFQALQLFPLPFSLIENKISQLHVVPSFQPSQKSTNKQEALNKKIYCVAPRLHSMMPVGRLMQKDPGKRHLAAEACTITGPPTRECFQFLLGPPMSYSILV